MSEEIATKGWIGGKDELMERLAALEADKDDEGRFLIYGQDVFFGIGGEEVVIDGRTEFSIGGKRRNLAAEMVQTGQGVGVAVIC